jgi:2-polyprenyl-3-methyl-5-hydroxy-6-metoxy-1,4-benzoquinol methylase
MKHVAIDLQKDFYDKRWSEEDSLGRLKLYRCVAILDAIAYTKIYMPKMIDLGCGSGWFVNILKAFGPTVGVDLSGKAMAKAREKYNHEHFYETNILDWNPTSDSFDIVVSQEVIEHIEKQEEYVNVVYTLLREGGYLILTTPNIRTFMAMPEHQSKSWSDQPVEKLLSIEQLRSLLSTKFDIVRLNTIIPGYGSRGLYRFLYSAKIKSILRIVGMEQVFEKICLRFGYGLHTLVIARKRQTSKSK